MSTMALAASDQHTSQSRCIYVPASYCPLLTMRDRQLSVIFPVRLGCQHTTANNFWTAFNEQRDFPNKSRATDVTKTVCDR